MIRERTRAGLREAREKGRVPGRKPRAPSAATAPRDARFSASESFASTSASVRLSSG
jgi:DNA invertase Pin-like site-specific DNA recombinase